MASNEKRLDDNYIFGLDIGTRSAVGIVGYTVENRFRIIAYAMIEHTTRAMIDGQIHDISKVTETIINIKQQLEKQLGVTLHKVCIAAAGRVLKTALIHVEQEIDVTQFIDDDLINSIELLGMEKAHQQINSNLSYNEMGYHCVGYTVSKYYLNDYEISSLKDHKGKKISADVLVSFLPQEVVESLYAVIKNADMEVYSLTLEPIAAINVAIPKQFRLLNIALVDIGAGTSDIAITKDGSIVAYGMIPTAGDELTEAIVHKYLVDFNTAEKIKIKASGHTKTISFKDVIGIKHSVTQEEVNQVIGEAVKQLADCIANRIIELNNGKSTNAVFIVGGGGQVKLFPAALSQAIKLPESRVALRGKSVLELIDFGELKVKKGPALVTPIGICLTGLLNNKHDFIQVFLNDEPIKLYDNGRLTIMDVAAYKGLDPKKLIARKGRHLEFTVNNAVRCITSDVGIPAKIMVNNTEVSLTHHITMNDYITIIFAKQGSDACLSIYQLLNELDLKVTVDNITYKLTPDIYVNDAQLTMNYDIQYNDKIRLVLPLLDSFLIQNNLDDNLFDYYVNGKMITSDYNLSDLDIIIKRPKKETQIINTTNTTRLEKDKGPINITVNHIEIILEGKSKYIFVDIFDVYEFDLSQAKGNIICKINNAVASYMGEINDGDYLEVYWEEKNS